jgi:2-polyprenyl-3-methyl-5-hydroxy-6-metoxy-1,4-benzoquinol methylase
MSASAGVLPELHDIEGDHEEEWQGEYLQNHISRYTKTAEIISSELNNGSVLEVGATPGHLAYLLSRIGFDVSVVDLDPSRIHSEVKKEVEETYRCDVERETIPYDDNTFDAVLLAEVFEHLSVDPLHALSELRRVVKPDGRLFLTTPNLYFLERVRQFVGFKDGVLWGSPADAFGEVEEKGHKGHIRVHTKSELIDTLERSGYDIVNTEYRMMEWDYWEPREYNGVKETIQCTAARWATNLVPRLRKTIIVVGTPG